MATGMVRPMKGRGTVPSRHACRAQPLRHGRSSDVAHHQIARPERPRSRDRQHLFGFGDPVLRRQEARRLGHVAAVEHVQGCRQRQRGEQPKPGVVAREQGGSGVRAGSPHRAHGNGAFGHREKRGEAALHLLRGRFPPPERGLALRCQTLAPGLLFNHVSAMAICHVLATRAIERSGAAGRHPPQGHRNHRRRTRGTLAFSLPACVRAHAGETATATRPGSRWQASHKRACDGS